MLLTNNINEYLKRIQMSSKWEMKKKGIDTDSFDNAEKDKNKMASIYAKLKSGKKLSSKEMSYLRNKNVDLYRKAVTVQAERESLKNQLESCSSKEDAHRIVSSKMQFCLNLSKGGEDELAEFLAAAIDDEFTSFIKSDKYSKLKGKSDDGLENSTNDKYIKNNNTKHKTKKKKSVNSENDILKDYKSKKKDIEGNNTMENKISENKNNQNIKTATDYMISEISSVYIRDLSSLYENSSDKEETSEYNENEYTGEFNFDEVDFASDNVARLYMSSNFTSNFSGNTDSAYRAAQTAYKTLSSEEPITTEIQKSVKA